MLRFGSRIIVKQYFFPEKEDVVKHLIYDTVKTCILASNSDFLVFGGKI